MCGIGGVMMYQKENRSELELTFIKELITNLAIENQARGSDATGFVVFNKKGNNVMKHNVPADELTSYATYWNFLEDNINKDTLNVLIHTRHATQGSPINNDNNHPIVTASAIGVHNGWINNDYELFRKENMFRLAEVDSEAIFRLADKELENERENTKNMAEKLTGAFAVAYVKKQEPHKLNWFRNNNPTTFAYIPDLNITVFASAEKYIKDAIATANASLYYETGFSVSEENIFYLSPKQDIVMQFDVTENTPVQQLQQSPLDFKDSDYGYYGYGRGWYEQEDWYMDRLFDEEEKSIKATNIYEFIEQKELHLLMSADDYSEMIELLNQTEHTEWSRGYQSGRSSLDSDMKILKEQMRNISNLDELAN